MGNCPILGINDPNAFVIASPQAKQSIVRTLSALPARMVRRLSSLRARRRSNPLVVTPHKNL